MRPRRPGPTVRTRVREATSAAEHDREDRLATEEPLEIRLSWPGRRAQRAWVTMRTPGHDFELAAGYLFHEGHLAPGSLRGVAYCTEQDLAPEQEFNVVTVDLDSAPAHPPAHRHDSLSSGSSACGVCGKDSVEAALQTRRTGRWAGEVPGLEVIRTLPEMLRGHQPVFDRTGGVHGAALCTADGSVIVAREDVGRHNAVDKVAGARLLQGAAPASAALVVSGRAGFELVQKAIAAGHGMLVAVGAPTSLSVRLAREAGLGLVGFTSPTRCVVYA